MRKKEKKNSKAMPKNILNIVEAPDDVDQEIMVQVADYVLSKLHSVQVEATVAFISDDDMQELNRQYRDKDYPTDVLSFPIEDDFPVDDVIYMGDIAISLDTAERQAEEFGHSLETEIIQLLIHGLIHLSGHDHEEDEGQMDALELKLRAETEKYYC